MTKLSEVKTEEEAAAYLLRIIAAGKSLALTQHLINTFDLADSIIEVVRGEIPDTAINAVAEVLWNDRDLRMGGPWDTRHPNEICVQQTKATARAAIIAVRKYL